MTKCPWPAWRAHSKGMMMIWYHGSSQSQFTGYLPGAGRSDEEDMLFLSRSPNVASRYGTVYRLDMDASALPRISVDDWFNDRSLEPGGSFVIEGDNGYDFPVDTLVLRHKPASAFVRVASPEALDDGLATAHEPEGPGDRQFETYIEEIYGGNMDAWRKDRDALMG